MKIRDYAKYDATGLAELVRKKEVSPKELALTAAEAIAKANPDINGVVETYDDRIDGLDEKSLGNGPFRGVPLLMKDVFGHEKGRKIEFGSRLCEGMVAEIDSNVAILLRKSGVNILGRSAAPEYSMAGTTEGLLYGNASNPWKKGYSTGGSSGGAQAAVTSGMVPIAHGSDIGGSIRIPASYCGGVGFKPSRMRVSVGPAVDEGGFGYSMNHVQTRTVRDSAAMLDCLAIPLVGDPFVIPKPDQPYAALIKRKPRKLRIGMILDEFAGVKVDPRGSQGGREGRQGARRHGASRRTRQRQPRRRRSAHDDPRPLLLRFRRPAELSGSESRPQAGPGQSRADHLVDLPARQGDHAFALHGRLEQGQHHAPQPRPVLDQLRHLAVADHRDHSAAVGHASTCRSRASTSTASRKASLRSRCSTRCRTT